MSRQRWYWGLPLSPPVMSLGTVSVVSDSVVSSAPFHFFPLPALPSRCLFHAHMPRSPVIVQLLFPACTVHRQCTGWANKQNRVNVCPQKSAGSATDRTGSPYRSLYHEKFKEIQHHVESKYCPNMQKCEKGIKELWFRDLIIWPGLDYFVQLLILSLKSSKTMGNYKGEQMVSVSDLKGEVRRNQMTSLREQIDDLSTNDKCVLSFHGIQEERKWADTDKKNVC